MKKYVYILSCIALTSISACNFNNTEESPLLVFINPNGTTMEAESNDHVILTFTAQSNIGDITTMLIEKSDEYYGIDTLVQKQVNSDSYNYVLDFEVPKYPDSTSTLLTFSVKTTDRNVAKIAKRIVINKGSSMVSESSGHVIYSHDGELPSAFDLDEMSPVFLADSINKNIDFIDDTVGVIGDGLSRTWLSFTDINFVAFNGFNYPEASFSSISEAYQNGLKLSRITNMQSDDIYIYGKNDLALGAIQILLVNDSEGTTEDKYVFNLKKIKTN